MEQELPPTEEVKQKLNDLALKIAEGGPGPRKEVIDAGGYDAIIVVWNFFCATGEDNIRVLW